MTTKKLIRLQIEQPILINTYHLWIDSAHKNEDRSSLQRQEFCHDLAFEMISQKN